ncbi:MAG: ribonuclease P protein component [Gammaproteobacteria bacterium]
MSNPKKINQNLKRVFSNKYFRIFKKSVSSNGLEISISKKYFKLAVDRNASKRRIKEIVRQNGLGDVLGGDYVFSVFRPFAELSYMQAEAEIATAIKQITKE